MAKNIFKARAPEFPGFSEPNPELSKLIYLWFLAILAGVAGLGFVAFTSMTRQGFGVFPAVCFALAIEVGTFGAGFNLARGNRATLFEIVVGLVTSGLYNYVHIRAVNVQALTKVADTDWVLLGVYGVGPLLIVFSAALWVGREIHSHELAVSGWRERARADLEKRKTETKQAETEHETRAAQLEFQKERLRLEAQERIEIARAAEERKTEIAKARIEAREKARQVSGDERKVTGNLPGDWRKLSDEDKAIILTLETPEIVQRYGVSDRTARNWRASAQNGNGKTHA